PTDSHRPGPRGTGTGSSGLLVTSVIGKLARGGTGKPPDWLFPASCCNGRALRKTTPAPAPISRQTEVVGIVLRVSLYTGERQGSNCVSQRLWIPRHPSASLLCDDEFLAT